MVIQTTDRFSTDRPSSLSQEPGIRTLEYRFDSSNPPEAGVRTLEYRHGPVTGPTTIDLVYRNSIPSEENPFQSAKRPTGDFQPAANPQPKEDDNFSSTFMFLHMLADKSADQQGNVSANAVDVFLKMLEAGGIDTTPLKNAISQISGKSYEEFIADTARNHISAQDLQDYRPSGRSNNGPALSNSGFDSGRAIRIAQSDNAGGGYCAKGTANVLEAMGYNIQRGHATNWDDTLPRNGWVKLRGVNAANAPEGSVLVYDSDIERGRNARNNGGGRYGHVEIVAENRSGERVYVSDAVRHNAGGSVPQNFEGAYMYVGPNAPASNLEIAQRLNNSGTQMAMSGPSPSIG